MLLIILLTIVSILMFLIYKKKVIKNKYVGNLLKYLSIVIIVTCILELFVFNFRHFESLLWNNEKELSFSIGNGIECDNDICEIIDSDNNYIEIKDFNEKIHNLNLDFESLGTSTLLNGSISLNDEANNYNHSIGYFILSSNNTRSHYYKINTSGKSNIITLSFSKEVTKVKINSIKINFYF